MEHRHFYDLPEYLEAGDVLVLNDTKVIPARLYGSKPTGGKLEVFLLKDLGAGVWQCLIGGKRRAVGLKLRFSGKLSGEIIVRSDDGTWRVRFDLRGGVFRKEMARIGYVPLPPYIKKISARDQERYQTVYADDKKSGSVAAPTAGLHFTPRLLKKLRAKGVKIVYVTLQVGLGTFAPVKTEKIEQHKMHSEYFEIKKETLQKIMAAKKRGRRVVAVGTTSARALESVVPDYVKKLTANSYQLKAISGSTDIFIYPSYKFKIVDALVTNFHLPKSTLLMLVSAFAAADHQNRSAGLEAVKKAYREAIRKKYRFFSYGDAMLIH